MLFFFHKPECCDSPFKLSEFCNGAIGQSVCPWTLHKTPSSRALEWTGTKPMKEILNKSKNNLNVEEASVWTPFSLSVEIHPTFVHNQTNTLTLPSLPGFTHGAQSD